MFVAVCGVIKIVTRVEIESYIFVDVETINQQTRKPDRHEAMLQHRLSKKR